MNDDNYADADADDNMEQMDDMNRDNAALNHPASLRCR